MWKNININKNQVETETASSTLIKCPKSSNYPGYKFWHPSKLVRSGKHIESLSVGYTDDFSFKLIKTGNGSHNKREILNAKEIDAEEFEIMFGVTSENIRSSQMNTESYLVVTEPTPINIEEKVDECLINK